MWTSQFLKAGHTVYMVDQNFRSRSAWAPRSGAATPSVYSAEYIQQRFTAPERYRLWPQTELHTQWPGTGIMGDAVFDAFYSSNLQFIPNATYQQQMQSAGTQLLDLIGIPVWLLGHSQGGLMPLLIADAHPKITKGLVLLEPTGPPSQERGVWVRLSSTMGLDGHSLTIHASSPRSSYRSCATSGGASQRNERKRNSILHLASSKPGSETAAKSGTSAHPDRYRRSELSCAIRLLHRRFSEASRL